MPELRQDWLTGRTVLVAENRARRPNEFATRIAYVDSAFADGQQTIASRKSPQPNCPFCVGNEFHTPPSLYQSTDEVGRWRVRVVPNMFPAVELHDAVGIASPALGAHEVIIEAAEHVERMSALTAEELVPVLVAYQQRFDHWRKDSRFRYGLLFKNQGARAGASLAHVHSQLVALPEVPATVERELVRTADQFGRHRRCGYCQLCEQELARGERVVLHRDGYLAFCPYASLQPLEVWLFPTQHQPWFEQSSSADSHLVLADVLRELFGKLETVIPDASYNMLLRNTPWRDELGESCHWRIEFLPRLNPLAGLELATGIHINPLPPEKAAARLRAL